MVTTFTVEEDMAVGMEIMGMEAGMEITAVMAVAMEDVAAMEVTSKYKVFRML